MSAIVMCMLASLYDGTHIHTYVCMSIRANARTCMLCRWDCLISLDIRISSIFLPSYEHHICVHTYAWTPSTYVHTHERHSHRYTHTCVLSYMHAHVHILYNIHTHTHTKTKRAATWAQIRDDAAMRGRDPAPMLPPTLFRITNGWSHQVSVSNVLDGMCAVIK